jgi:hypothetical protein
MKQVQIYNASQQCLVRFLQADKIIFFKLWFFWLSPPGTALAPWLHRSAV